MLRSARQSIKIKIPFRSDIPFENRYNVIGQLGQKISRVEVLWEFLTVINNDFLGGRVRKDVHSSVFAEKASQSPRKS